jgi:hypothetical protein
LLLFELSSLGNGQKVLFKPQGRNQDEIKVKCACFSSGRPLLLRYKHLSLQLKEKEVSAISGNNVLSIQFFRSLVVLLNREYL